MDNGPGKYDHICQVAREMAGITEPLRDHQAACVIIFNGNKGSGFSVQGDPRSLLEIAGALETVAVKIREGIALHVFTDTGTKQ